MTDISERINGLPQSLHDAIDYLQAGNLVECLHSILRAGDEYVQQRVYEAVSRRDLLQLEERYDVMHAEFSNQMFSMRTQLYLTEQEKADLARQMSEAASEAKRHYMRSEQQYEYLTRLYNDLYAYYRTLLKANSELTALQEQNGALEAYIAELSRYKRELTSSALRISNREEVDVCKSQETQTQSSQQAKQPGFAQEETSDQMQRSAQTYYANNVQIMPLERPEDSFIHIQAFDAQTQTYIGTSVKGVQYDAEKLVEYEKYAFMAYTIDSMRVPTQYSRPELIHLVGLLYQQVFDLRNIIMQYYVTKDEDKVAAFMQLDKMDAIQYLVTQNENLLGILDSLGAIDIIASRSREDDKLALKEQLEHSRQQIAVLKQKYAVLSQLQPVPKDKRQLAFYKAMCYVYDEIFEKGVRVQIAHLLRSTDANDSVSERLAVKLAYRIDAARHYITMHEYSPEVTQRILDALLCAARNPGNQPFLNAQLAIANQCVNDMQTQIVRYNRLIAELREFTGLLSDQLEGKILSLQRVADGAFDAAKIAEIQQLASQQNEVILGLREALKAMEKPETCSRETQAADFESTYLLDQNAYLQREIAQMRETNAYLVDKLDALVSSVDFKYKAWYIAGYRIRSAGNAVLKDLEGFSVVFLAKMTGFNIITEKVRYTDFAVSAACSRTTALVRRVHFVETALNQYTQVIKLDCPVQTEFPVYIEREVQNCAETQSTPSYTEPGPQLADFTQQYDAVCDNCEMARGVYDEIKGQNALLYERIAAMRQESRTMNGRLELTYKDLEIARQKAEAAIKYIKVYMKLTTRVKIEARYHRQRALELAQQNQELVLGNRTLTQKNEHLTQYIAAGAKGKDAMRQELQAISEAYEAVAEYAKTSKERAAKLQKQLQTIQEELNASKNEGKDAIAACKQYQQYLEKSVDDTQKWRKRYIQQRYLLPKRYVDEEKRSALESILSTDDIQSIYEW